VGRLDGQTALVTGASSGIGAATARLLMDEGADVIGLARSEAGLRAAGVGRRVVVDVTDREALERAVPDELDIAVVATAAGAFGRFDEMPPEDFDRCVEVTFGGSVNTIRAVLPRMRPGGRVIVLGSAADSVPLPLMSPYVAAKHALDGFLQSLRTELGDEIELCVVRPGAVDSPFWRHLSNPAGLTPPQLPPLLAYSAETVARAVVACALRARWSVTVGGSTLVLQAVNTVARPVTERALSLVGRLSRAAAAPDPAPNALWEGSGDGTVSGGLGGRPSLVASVLWWRS
jgi:NAD(P)-dependent dehydrogenase (short-subunit alcohol dehydrogenase family)